MGYLKNMFVEEFEDIKNGYKIIFQFDPNPYFENETLVKEYHLMGHDGNPKMVITPIRWKPDRNLICNNQDKIRENVKLTILIPFSPGMNRRITSQWMTSQTR